MADRKTSKKRDLGKTEQLDLFVSLPSDLAARDGQELMERPLFSLGKTKRIKPIRHEANGNWVEVFATSEFGMATIWDADIVIWAVSQIVEARDHKIPTSRRLRVAPYDLLTFMRRQPGGWQYKALREALERLQSTTVRTNIRQGTRKTHHQFSWVNEVKILEDDGRPIGIEFIIPDWLYEAALDPRAVLTIDRDYFDISRGIDRWLYRLARKHVGHQPRGWSCGFDKLYDKSGSTQRAKDFACDLREAEKRDALPSYRMEVRRGVGGAEVMHFTLRPKLALTSD